MNASNQFAIASAFVALLASMECATAQFDNLDWQLDSSAPPPRVGQSVNFMPGVGVVLFGGVDAEFLRDTWVWSAEAWRRIDSDSMPSARYWHAAVYDSLRARLVLVGGRDGQTVSDETWVFDGTEWMQLAPPTTPTPVYGHTLAYDSARDRVVLKGGRTTSSGQPNYELWEFDGTTWHLMPQAGTEPGFIGTLVYDAARDDVLYWNGVLLSAWDGTSWSPRHGSGLPTPSSCQLAYDPSQQRVLAANPLVSGDPTNGTYEYTGNGWSLVAATPHDNQKRTMTFDTVNQRMVALQGSTFAASRPMDTWSLAADSFDEWSRIAPSAPRARHNAAMAYDRARRRTMLVGGAPDDGELDHREWRIITGTGLRFHGMAYDEARGELLAFGGTSPIGSTLLRFDGSIWYSDWPPPSPAPEARRKCAMAYDSVRKRTYMFGGAGFQPTFADLWYWDGTGWTNVVGPGPEGRFDTAMCYDRDRDRIVLFGGVGQSPLGDTWEFDGTSWTQLLPANSPPARGDHLMVYHEYLQRTVLYGGTDGTDDFRDTWLWDGTTWSQLATTHVPDTGIGTCGSYDSDRQELIVFGGGDIFGGLNGAMWRLARTDIGSWQSSGQGCVADTLPLVLSAADAPAIGRTSRIRLDNTTSSFVVLPLGWVGFDDQQWYGVPLPISLAALNRPDCFVWAGAEVFLPMLGLGTYAEAELALPDDPSAVGVELFVQGASFDFATGELATANLLRAVVGVP